MSLTILTILYHIFICYGITMLIVQTKIMEPVRTTIGLISNTLNYFVNCMMCIGFWVSLFFLYYNEITFSYVFFSTDEPLTLWAYFTYIFFDSAFTTSFIWFIYLIQLNLEKYVKHEL